MMRWGRKESEGRKDPESRGEAGLYRGLAPFPPISKLQFLQCPPPIAPTRSNNTPAPSSTHSTHILVPKYHSPT